MHSQGFVPIVVCLDECSGWDLELEISSFESRIRGFQGSEGLGAWGPGVSHALQSFLPKPATLLSRAHMTSFLK